MAYEAPALGTAGQVYTAAAHNIIVADILAFRSIQNRSIRKDFVGSNIAITSTTWVVVESTLDATVNAAAGDVIEFGMSALIVASASTLFFDAVTFPGSVLTNALGSKAAFVNSGYQGPNWASLQNADICINSTILYTLVAGDISGGTVTVRLVAKLVDAGTKSIAVTSGFNPLIVYLKNLGPVTT